MSECLNETGWDLLFRQARSYPGWQDRQVSDDLLKEIYELVKMGPTGSNSCPMRISFVRSDEAKERLLPCIGEGNRAKAMSAPVTAIFAYDTKFYELTSRLWPHGDGGERLSKNPELAEKMGRFNAALQTAFFMLAARGMGLDCGPLAGFNPPMVDETFFPDGRWKSIMLCNLGYGDKEQLKPRQPRLDFEEACELL